MEKQNANGRWRNHKSLFLFLIAFLIAVCLTLLLKEPGFTDSQVYVLFLFFFAIGLWITEAIPAFAVSLFIMAYLVFALGNKYLNSDPGEVEIYVRTFSDSIIWLLLGGFFLAKAMAKTKLDESLFRFTLKIAGTNPRVIIIWLMGATMLISMVLSNTATTSMMLAAMLPLVKSIDKNPGFAKSLLLGIPLASTAGGIATIIGTPANAMAVGALQSAGIKIEFLDWMMYGVPIALIITALSCLLLILMYVKDTSPIPFPAASTGTGEKSGVSSLHRNIVIAVIIVTVGLWLTTSLHGIKVASVCAVPLVVFTLTGVLDGKDVQSMPWDTLLLVAGGISLGLSLGHTGLLEHYAKMLSGTELSSIFMLVTFGFLSMLLANVMTNSTATAIMAPVCMAILPEYMTEAALIVAISSSAALVLLASSPSNAIVYSTGLVEQKDFRFTGIMVGILGPLLTILWVLWMS